MRSITALEFAKPLHEHQGSTNEIQHDSIERVTECCSALPIGEGWADAFINKRHFVGMIFLLVMMSKRQEFGIQVIKSIFILRAEHEVKIHCKVQLGVDRANRLKTSRLNRVPGCHSCKLFHDHWRNFHGI